jgi:hypothetical protein
VRFAEYHDAPADSLTAEFGRCQYADRHSPFPHSKDFDMTEPTPAPVPAAQPAPAVPAEKWNVLSIVGFVLSLVGFSVISVILGFIGLSQIKKTGERGRGLAIAAIIIGFASIVIGIIVAIVVTAALASNADLVTY